MTPQDKCDRVRMNSGDLFPRLYREIVQLTRNNRNIGDNLRRMNEIIDDLAGEVAKEAICKKGCNHCCYQSVLISEWEAKRIAKFTGRKMADYCGYDPEHDSAQKLRDRFCNKPCTFLSEDGCDIYPVRPFACRLHFSMGDDAQLCDIQNFPGKSVPYFDFEKVKMAAALMQFRLNEKFGDIREFFGERDK